jgi:hypothetical protein
MQVPNSAGTAQPKLSAPPNACDCHMHIYDGGRFPPPRPESRMQPNACVPDYRLFQQRIGIRRTVVVTPAAYITDNEVTLDAIAQLGPQARGVAVVHPTVTDAELNRLVNGGIRGIRFTQFDPATATTSIDMIEPLAKRIANLGWHIQFIRVYDDFCDSVLFDQLIHRNEISGVALVGLNQVPKETSCDTVLVEEIIRRVRSDGDRALREMAVTFDTPRENFNVIDQGGSRTLADLVFEQAERHSERPAVISSTIWPWVTSRVGTCATIRPR